MGANLKLVDQAIAAYNSGDMKAFCAFYADDAVLVTPDGTYTGQAEILERWLDTQAAFPDGTVTVTLAVDDGSCVVNEWTFKATNTGPLTMPDGSQIPATGLSLEVPGMDITEIRDGKITSHRMYFDNVAAFTQLGLMPAAT